MATAMTDIALPAEAGAGGAGKFEPTGYRDRPWAVVFVLQLLAVVALGFWGIAGARDDDAAAGAGAGAHTPPPYPGPAPPPAKAQWRAEAVAACVIVAAAAAVVCCAVLLFLLRRMARRFIWLANVGTIVLGALAAFACFAEGAIGAGIILLFLCVLNALWLYLVRHRIRLAAVILSNACATVFRFPAVIAVAVAGCVVSVAYFFLWAFAVRRVWKGSSAAGIVLLFCFYWSTQVFKNVVHVTVSGVVATWYFLAAAVPANPTVGALRRACTTSFGSVCLGSLIVAVIQTIRAVLHQLRNQENAFLTCCVDCILGCLQDLVEYFNQYAYTHIAIYGKPYVQAAKDAWRLVCECGIAAIINDSLIANTLLWTCLVLALFCGVLSAFAAVSPASYLLYAILGTAVAFCILALVLSIVTSAVVTIFVCYAEEPQALTVSNPELARQLLDAVRELEADAERPPAAPVAPVPVVAPAAVPLASAPVVAPAAVGFGAGHGQHPPQAYGYGYGHPGAGGAPYGGPVAGQPYAYGQQPMGPYGQQPAGPYVVQQPGAFGGGVPVVPPAPVQFGQAQPSPYAYPPAK